MWYLEWSVSYQRRGFGRFNVYISVFTYAVLIKDTNRWVLKGNYVWKLRTWPLRTEMWRMWHWQRGMSGDNADHPNLFSHAMSVSNSVLRAVRTESDIENFNNQLHLYIKLNLNQSQTREEPRKLKWLCSLVIFRF